MMPGELGAVFVYGQLRGLGRTVLSESLVKTGARLVRNSRRADTVVVGHRALDTCVMSGGRLHLPFTPDPAARLLSEAAFGRRLAGAPTSPAAGPYTMEEVGRLAGLPVDTCAALALFDVIGEGHQRFGYRDLSAARQVAALLAENVAMPTIIRAAWALDDRGSRLSQVRLAAAPWGELVESVGGRMVRLDGQYALVLDESLRDAAACFAAASASERDGNGDAAELWYGRAIAADPADPLPCFNLGNVLVSRGRAAEAAIAFQQALARDPGFAEAAFNIAALAEHSDQPARAIPLYRQVVAAHPAYPQPLYNLARLLTVGEAYAEALPLWERFIALAPDDADAKHARRAALLCRLAGRQDRNLPGPAPD